MDGNGHDDGNALQNYGVIRQLSVGVKRASNCHPEAVLTSLMHLQKVVVTEIEPGYYYVSEPVKDGTGGLCHVCEADPCFTLTICSYGDLGGVTWSQREIENR